MIPKEKAKELIGKYSAKLPFYTQKDNLLKSKECALITVNEILESHYFVLSGVKPSIYNYWQEVKKEIEKLQ